MNDILVIMVNIVNFEFLNAVKDFNCLSEHKQRVKLQFKRIKIIKCNVVDFSASLKCNKIEIIIQNSRKRKLCDSRACELKSSLITCKIFIPANFSLSFASLL